MVAKWYPEIVTLPSIVTWNLKNFQVPYLEIFNILELLPGSLSFCFLHCFLLPGTVTRKFPSIVTWRFLNYWVIIHGYWTICNLWVIIHGNWKQQKMLGKLTVNDIRRFPTSEYDCQEILSTKKLLWIIPWKHGQM